MPPPGHELLLRAICNDPDDTTLRLAYADWLDENDDPARAEFVRVQCRLASLGFGLLSPYTGTANPESLTRGLAGESVALVRRQAELWEANRDAWLAELPELPGSVVSFHRGFAAVVTAEHPGGLVRNGAKLFRIAPVTRVVFRDCTPDAVEVALVQPWSDAVRGLTVGWRTPQLGAGNRVAEVLGRSEYLTWLRDLSLPGVALTNVGAHELSVAPFVKQLERFDLAGNRIRDAGALSVANAVNPARLRVLDLSGNPLTDSCRHNLRRKLGDRVYVEGREEES
jgi:uncharacterized protein (TIGR02996 family)